MAGVGDAAAIADIYRPYVTDAVTSFEVDAARRRRDGETHRRPCSRWRPGWSRSTTRGAPIGYAYASRHAERAAYQWSVDATVYIREGDHRRGVGRALYGALFPLLRLQGFYVAHAGVTLPNAASVGLHESFGFRPVGVYPAVGWKFGAWRDVGWWHLPLQERPATPAPPLSLAEAQTTPVLAGSPPNERLTGMPSERSAGRRRVGREGAGLDDAGTTDVEQRAGIAEVAGRARCLAHQPPGATSVPQVHAAEARARIAAQAGLVTPAMWRARTEHCRSGLGVEIPPRPRPRRQRRRSRPLRRIRAPCCGGTRAAGRTPSPRSTLAARCSERSLAAVRQASERRRPRSRVVSH